MLWCSVGTSASNVASYFKEPGTADVYLIGQTVTSVEVNRDLLCSACKADDIGRMNQCYLVWVNLQITFWRSRRTRT
ncbi:hypothetical protein EmuJ_000566900 [Echinococcus multilocularis]|uniref:Uncharacterized protein n=1 Tax=Echinococcus multilocularis TaxID=6211 RepID=A0A068Y514_ECHMU|nr:hypothetical protein EmuJ_000566900 [Echinococcus multilocularis]